MKIFLKNIKVKINFLNIKNKLKNENLLIYIILKKKILNLFMMYL